MVLRTCSSLSGTGAASFLFVNFYIGAGEIRSLG